MGPARSPFHQHDDVPPPRRRTAEDRRREVPRRSTSVWCCDHLPLVHHLVRETLTRVPAACHRRRPHAPPGWPRSCRLRAPSTPSAASSSPPSRPRGSAERSSTSCGRWTGPPDQSGAVPASSTPRARRSPARQGRDATDQELAAHTGLTLQEVRANRAGVARAAVLSLQGFGDASIDEIVPARGPSAGAADRDARASRAAGRRDRLPSPPAADRRRGLLLRRAAHGRDRRGPRGHRVPGLPDASRGAGAPPRRPGPRASRTSPTRSCRRETVRAEWPSGAAGPTTTPSPPVVRSRPASPASAELRRAVRSAGWHGVSRHHS